MMVEVFRGVPYNDRELLEEWAARLTRNRTKETIAVAADAISCQKTRKILENKSDLNEEELKAALIHVATCWDDKCKEIRHQFKERNPIVS